jgi:hypothetical protein
MRTAGCAVVASCVLLAGTYLRAQTGTTPTCTDTLWDPRLVDVPSSEWANDHSYDVTTSGPADDRSFYVTGDTVEVSERFFQSLVRPLSAPNTKVKSITFEARVLVIDMPLVFDSTTLRLWGETLILTNRASIVFTAPVPRDGGDGLEIVADTLDLENSKARPFQFTTNNWRFLTEANQRPWPSSATRHVTVAAAHLKTGDTSYRDDPYLFVRSLTLDSTFSYPPQQALARAPFTLNLGDEGAGNLYATYLSERATWPVATARKVGRQFARAPYDVNNQEYLIRSIIQPYLRLLPDAQEEARSELLDVRQRIHDGVDAFGYTKYFAPKLSFFFLQKEFSERLKTELVLLEAWDSVIVTSSESGVIEKSRLQEFSKRSDDLQERLKKSRDDLNSTVGSLDTKEQDIAATLNRMDVRRLELEKRLQELIEKDENNKKLGIATRVIAVAASLIPATAPVALAAGTLIAATGDLVYKHNTGQPVTAQTLITVAQDGKAFVEKVRAMRGAWDVAHKAVDDALTAKGDEARANANQDVLKKAGEFFEKARAVNDLLSIPGPTPINMNQLEQEDPQLQGLIKELAAQRSEESELLARIDTQKRAVATTVAEWTGVDAELRTFLAAKVTNGWEASRQQALAFSIRESITTGLAADAAILRRAYSLYTGQTLDTPQDVVFFADSYRPLQNASQTGETLAKALEDDRTRLKPVYETLATVVKDGYQKYLDTSGRPPKPMVGLFTASRSDSGDKVRQAFLDSLNARISERIAVKSSGSVGESSKAASSLILIPFDAFGDYAGLPEWILHIEVRSVRYKNKSAMQGKTLQLTVVHPSVGFVMHDRRCALVDQRGPAGGKNMLFFNTVDKDGLIDTKDVQQLYGAALADLDKFAPSPLRSRYWLSVEVDGSMQGENWKNVPIIDEIEFAFYAIK